MQGNIEFIFYAIIPKMGFNRPFLREVVVVLVYYQGKGLDDYEAKQYTHHLARFVRYLRMKDRWEISLGYKWISIN